MAWPLPATRIFLHSGIGFELARAYGFLRALDFLEMDLRHA